MLNLSLALVVFLFPLAFSPGPGNMFFAANGARFGLRATLPANVGYHVATWIVTLSIGFGFAAIMSRAPVLFDVIRWVGSAYVLFLAWRFLRAGQGAEGAVAQSAGAWGGAVLLLTNPKAYLIMTVMFSQFLGQTEGQRILGVVVISTVFTLNNMVAFTAWTLVGDRIAARFRHERGARLMNRVFAGVLAAVALWMLWP
ncbi:LysE family translocator [Gymnodinialimonas ceratoperidinii]|uniref:LysE family translocator n=2 Tax=Gymnodinialimonas ceratoperidinii TaxID=2856823 RepID=A0A8F6U0C6_9RHOB|nr:LysE family translocator [Gymnodinialimonas ceratoperidinii]QXT41309.1 LysE family translocator [Gymnodinialimonas ceratoperidinii]